MRTLKKAQSGFTLVEVLVALTIFAVGLLAIANMQITALIGNNTANVQTAASFVGQGALEEFMALSDTDPIFAADVGPVNLDPVDLTGAGFYAISYEIDRDNPVDGVAKVTISVDGPNTEIVITGFKRISL